jgi:hypothetical protein
MCATSAETILARALAAAFILETSLIGIHTPRRCRDAWALEPAAMLAEKH